MVGVRQDVDLAAMVLETPVGVTTVPVLFDDVAVAQVLDAGAADVDEVGVGPRLRQPVEGPSELARQTFEGGTSVWRSQIEDVGDQARPRFVAREREVPVNARAKRNRSCL